MQNHSYVSVILPKMMIYTTQKITRVHSSYTLYIYIYTHICRTPSEALQIPSKLFEAQDKLIPPDTERVCFACSLNASGKSSGCSADPAVDSEISASPSLLEPSVSG